MASTPAPCSSDYAETFGVQLAAGSGTWSSLSDRNAKTAIATVDDDSVLAKIARLPIDTWRYRSESGVRHVGPMAQDFYAAFGVGQGDWHIAAIDEDGLALAAVKSLYVKLVRKDRTIDRLETRLVKAEARLDALAPELSRLHETHDSARPR